ncbi:hypothetical protein GJ496_007347 [Pomphorhynchus laevis]|nr:hypothetical protein GJ496_007347 [Pomphorhynchus laevis]
MEVESKQPSLEDGDGDELRNEQFMLANDSNDTTWTKYLFLSSLLVASSASFNFGYGIGSFGTKPLTTGGSQSYNFIDEYLPALFFTGSMAGFFTSALWYKFKFVNRKNIFFINYIFALIAALLAIGYRYEALSAISTLIHGYQGGMACDIVPTYLNEISPQKIRGKVNFLHQLFITIGILTGQIVGIKQILGSGDIWQYTYLIGAFPCFGAMFVIKYLPMSPIELVIRFKDRETARSLMCRLRGTEDVSADMDLIDKEIEIKQNDTLQMGIRDVILSPYDRRQLIIIVSLLSVQALSGINSIFFFANKIFDTLLDNQYATRMTLGTGLVNVVATISGLYIVKVFGRRTLILWSTVVISLCYVILTGLLSEWIVYFGETEKVFFVILILVLISAFAVGLGPIPFMYAAEITRPESRNAILNTCLVCNYIINIMILFAMNIMIEKLKECIFMPFAFYLIAGNVLFFFKMPETRNKSITEIEKLFVKAV